MPTFSVISSLLTKVISESLSFGFVHLTDLNITITGPSALALKLSAVPSLTEEDLFVSELDFLIRADDMAYDEVKAHLEANSSRRYINQVDKLIPELGISALFKATLLCMEKKTEEERRPYFQTIRTLVKGYGANPKLLQEYDKKLKYKHSPLSYVACQSKDNEVMKFFLSDLGVDLSDTYLPFIEGEEQKLLTACDAEDVARHFKYPELFRFFTDFRAKRLAKRDRQPLQPALQMIPEEDILGGISSHGDLDSPENRGTCSERPERSTHGSDSEGR